MSEIIKRTHIEEVLLYEVEGVTRFPGFGKAVLCVEGTNTKGTNVQVAMKLNKDDIAWLMNWCAGSLKKFRDDLNATIEFATESTADL